MFACLSCQSTQFQLMIQADFAGQVSITTDENNEVEVSVGAQTFMADLAFMNQFALCESCGAVGQWDYHYPEKTQETSHRL